MSDLNLDEIRNNLQHKSTQELIDLITFHLGDYNPQVILIVEDILLNRGLQQSDINRSKSAYKLGQEKTTSKPKSKLGFWEKAIGSLLIGIPVILLSRWVGTTVARYEHPNHK